MSDSRRCSLCGELAKKHWEFCTSCGAPLPGDVPEISNRGAYHTPLNHSASSTAAEPEWNQHSGQRQQIPDIETLSNGESHSVISNLPGVASMDARTAPTLTMLQGYGRTPQSSSQRRWWHAGALGLTLLCLVVAVGISSWYFWSNRSTATPSVDSRARDQNSVPEKPSNSPITESPATPEAVSNAGADEEFNALRDRGIKANASERRQIVAALEDAEKKYRNDYRFPYERAKLTIVGVHSHDESFAALMRSAEIAIDNGKAEQMMENLMADKSGDLRKLSHGHLEWSMIEEALRSRDKAALKTLPRDSPEDR